MSTVNPTHIIAEAVRDGLYEHDAETIAAYVVSELTDAGYSIVSHSELRALLGPSREVDDCPQCNETAQWERNDYDLRDNDDHRYSWRAYCETCNLDLELMPWPNPPVAAAVEGEKP